MQVRYHYEFKLKAQNSPLGGRRCFELYRIHSRWNLKQKNYFAALNRPATASQSTTFQNAEI